MNNYARIIAIQRQSKKRLLKVNPQLDNVSGVYVFERLDESGIRFGYVGQAKHILDRCIQHLMGYQKIDLSIKKHGLFDAKNRPNGYKLWFELCPEENLDNMEREYIKILAKRGVQLKNSTLGGQDAGKVVEEVKPSRGYRDGLQQGYKNCKKEVVNVFSKYLKAEIKGDPNKIKERKLEEFNSWLEE